MMLLGPKINYEIQGYLTPRPGIRVFWNCRTRLVKYFKTQIPWNVRLKRGLRVEKKENRKYRKRASQELRKLLKLTQFKRLLGKVIGQSWLQGRSLCDWLSCLKVTQESPRKQLSWVITHSRIRFWIMQLPSINAYCYE